MTMSAVKDQYYDASSASFITYVEGVCEAFTMKTFRDAIGLVKTCGFLHLKEASYGYWRTVNGGGERRTVPHLMIRMPGPVSKKFSSFKKDWKYSFFGVETVRPGGDVKKEDEISKSVNLYAKKKYQYFEN
uniref:Ras-associating domain-containing protein n=1 Tax=Steinernema glaseri TaxID=37863 RepID=A0A1I8AS47_9BILA